MKQMIKTATVFFTIILLLLTRVQAQFDDVGIDPDAPIDGGLSLLMAAGVGYGAKKLKEKRKR